MTNTIGAGRKEGGNIRVYSPENRFDIGAFAAMRALLNELVIYRSHIRTIFMGRFRAAYSGAVLGVFWNIILPAVPISVYILLASMRVFPAYEGISPAVYIAFNVTLWYLLVGFIRQPIDIVQSRNAEAMKTALPLSASIASSFAQLLFDTLVRIAVVTILVVVFAQWPAMFAPAAFGVLAAGAVLFLGAGLILAVLNAVFPDVERVVTITLQYGIFLSGVIFPISSMPTLQFLEYANPFNVFIHAARDLFFTGVVSYPAAVAGWALVGVFLVFLGVRFFYVMEYRLRGLA